MNNWGMPPPSKLIEEWANASLASIGKPKPVSKMWVYRFINRLPSELQLGPMKQCTKESKRIQAEYKGLLSHWYHQLKIQLEGVPARLVYNFDECGFRPGEGKNQNVDIKDRKRSCPDLDETERGENITVIECIAADGWQMDPLFIFKSSRSTMECWFDGSEYLAPNTMDATSKNGWISDILASEWLDWFIKATATPDRTKRGEKRILIFDGHGAHLTLEFLQKCEDHDIIPFGFLPHSTHICQPLDDTPFLSYKQRFQSPNNEISHWTSKPVVKGEFLRMIEPIRLKIFKQRIIRESFKECGIYPVDDSKVLSKLPNGERGDTPDLTAPGLRSYDYSTPSPSPETDFSSSSIDNSPSNSVNELQKNLAKLSKRAGRFSPKTQRNIDRIAHHGEVLINQLNNLNRTITQMTAIQQHISRHNTKRHNKEI